MVCVIIKLFYQNNVGVDGDQGGDGMKKDDEGYGCGPSWAKSELVRKCGVRWWVLECWVEEVWDSFSP
jgi:hypothetical protein